MGNTDGELSDDAGSNRGGSYLGGDDTGDEEQGEGKRPRRRRRAQVGAPMACCQPVGHLIYQLPDGL